MIHYECDYQRGGLVNPAPESIIIKLTPSEFNYEDAKSYFHKRIILIRENVRDQAESRVYADLVEKKFEPYTIDNQFIKDNEEKISEMMELIQKENEFLKGLNDCLHITYDEIYNSPDGLKKIENYLGTNFNFILNNSKKYRNSKKTLI
jgi:hypothetical protein